MKKFLRRSLMRGIIYGSWVVFIPALIIVYPIELVYFKFNFKRTNASTITGLYLWSHIIELAKQDMESNEEPVKE